MHWVEQHWASAEQEVPSSQHPASSPGVPPLELDEEAPLLVDPAPVLADDRVVPLLEAPPEELAAPVLVLPAPLDADPPLEVEDWAPPVEALETLMTQRPPMQISSAQHASVAEQGDPVARQPSLGPETVRSLLV